MLLSKWFESRKRRIGRNLIYCFGALFFSYDYYNMRIAEVFDAEDAEQFRVCFDRISKPRAALYAFPKHYAPVMSFFAPKNGDVVRGRVMPGNPRWVQLIGGRFMERCVAGVEVCELVVSDTPTTAPPR